MHKFFPRKKRLFILLAISLLVFIATLTSTILFIKSKAFPFKKTNTSLTERSFPELKLYFSDLAKKEGGVHAFKALKQATLPPNTDLHLLGHVIGEILYLQKGAGGMQYCTQDFRNACSHTIVVGLFLDKGDTALDDIKKACEKAPGGPGAYTMCYHGLGHGILAYTNYNMSQTIQICKKTGSQKHNFQEYPECVGGAIMEQITGGDHDPQTWSKQREVNLRNYDPLYPCNSNEIIPDEEAKKLCYIYLTPHLFNLGGINIRGKPPDSTIAKSFTFCESIPESKTSLRDSCFGGFGKEFVVLARDRDIREVENMPDWQLTKVFNWCQLTENQEGQRSCIKFALGSLFWGGENKSIAAIRFCNLIPDEKGKDFCFSSLTNNVRFYIKDTKYRQAYCNSLPQIAQDYCFKTLIPKSEN